MGGIGSGRKPKMGPKQLPEVLRMIRQGKSNTQIGEHFGVTFTAIPRLLKRHGYRRVIKQTMTVEKTEIL